MTAFLRYKGTKDEPAYYDYRSAYKDADTALAEAAHVISSSPNRRPHPVAVEDADGKVLHDEKKIKSEAKKAARKKA